MKLQVLPCTIFFLGLPPREVRVVLLLLLELEFAQDLGGRQHFGRFLGGSLGRGLDHPRRTTTTTTTNTGRRTNTAPTTTKKAGNRK